jgi:hypothetical protein
MLTIFKVNRNDLHDSWLLGVLDFCNVSLCLYGKLEKQALWSFLTRPRKLLIHHSASKPEMLGLLCHVIVVERGAQSASLLERRVIRGLNRQSSRHGDFHVTKRRYMNILRQLRNYWIPWVTTIVLVCFNPAVAQEITTFSAPGAGTGAGQGTGGFGINQDGTVVGSFLDSGNVFHGFQCVSGCGSPSTFNEFNAPGAGTSAGQGTITFSINQFGVVAGFLVDASNVAHGFVTTAPFKTFTILNDPDAGQGSGQGTFAGNVNERGEIAGNYIDASGVSHGFVTAPPFRTFKSFDPKGSVSTLPAVASALNLGGEVTGTYSDAGGALHGFVRAANGAITEFNVTGAGTASGQGTGGVSISDLGVITGNFIDASGVNHGFVRGPFGATTTFNVAEAGAGSGQGTVPEGIDLLGEITGQYIDSNGVNHGFVRSPFGAITTFDAPGAGTASGQGTLPNTPNVFGVITGQYIDSTGLHHGFLRYP